MYLRLIVRIARACISDDIAALRTSIHDIASGQ